MLLLLQRLFVLSAEAVEDVDALLARAQCEGWKRGLEGSGSSEREEGVRRVGRAKGESAGEVRGVSLERDLAVGQE